VAPMLSTLPLLLGVLAFAVVRPRGLPEALVAVPVAVLVLVLGLADPATAGRRVLELVPTLVFLAAVLVLAHLAGDAGVFTWLGRVVARACRGEPRRLLGLTFCAAAVTTTVLSLDATVVLLTPVVLTTASGLRLPARPHVYACTHLANSASTLLPVSNLTNLLCFGATGLPFAGFAALMAGPWLVTLAIEYLVFRRYFARDLTESSDAEVPAPGPAPRFALWTLAAVLAGFCVVPLLGVDPMWVAVAGALVLAVQRRAKPVAVVRAAAPLLCLFVAALAVVVEAVAEHGGRAVLTAVLPDSTGLLGLLAVAGVAAVLANVVNNLPATLLLLSVLGPHAPVGVLLAALLGVNIGPNLTYVGSLATLLWRRVLHRHDAAPGHRDFTVLGLLTVPACLAASVTALWLALQV
jgi:arsenical pump membrane protein